MAFGPELARDGGLLHGAQSFRQQIPELEEAAGTLGAVTVLMVLVSLVAAAAFAVIAARREKVIAARFHDIDTNHNGQIDYNEFLAWQMQLGSLAQSDRGAGPYGEVVPASITPDLGDGERDAALMTAIEPLNAVTIAKADKNYDGAVTLDELLAYENVRFEKADIDKDGYLSQDEIMQMRGGRRGMGAPGMGPR